MNCREVRIDGAVVGIAKLGMERPDIVTAYGRSDYLRSGWTLTVGLGQTATGAHAVSAVAYDSAERATALGGSAQITVTANGGSQSPPFGWIDQADDGSGNTTLLQGNMLVVRGWACDVETPGAPVSRVEVRIDGVQVGNATLGQARPDVADALDRSDCLNSGWSLSVNIGGLGAGTHSVSAVAVDSASNVAELGGSRNITVTAVTPSGWTDYIYLGATLVATQTGSTLKYHHNDHLSMRLTTDTSGNTLAQQGHYPFGETWYQGSGNSKWKFTSYERDPETGNDYAVFRKYVPRLGRFCSADRLAGRTANPQSLNRFAYALNDPVNLIDPLGLDVLCITWEVWRCHDVVRASADDRGWETVCEYEGEFSGGCYGFSGGGGGGGEEGGGGEGGADGTQIKKFVPCDVQVPSDAEAALLGKVIFAEATASGISEANSKLEMAAIGFAVVNRQALLANGIQGPYVFGATGTSLADVLTPTQFASVGGARFNLAGNPSQINVASAGGATECENLKRAFATATGVLSRHIDDPFGGYGGTYGFRTSGHGPPGGTFYPMPPASPGSLVPQILGSGNVFFGFGRP